MKPDIVFFGEGLSDEFHSSIARDKEHVDLLIVIGSSLKVRPVALVPSSVPETVPQILINREPLHHLTFDVELLGNCDLIINQICHMLGEGWKSPIHQDPLEEHLGVPDETPSNPGDKGEEEVAGAAAATKEDRPEVNGTKDNVTDEDYDAKDTKDEEEEEEEVRGKSRARHESGSLAEKIPDGKFLFLPPARYVFSGAEVFVDSSDDEEDDEEDEEDEDTNNEEETAVDGRQEPEESAPEHS